MHYLYDQIHKRSLHRLSNRRERPYLRVAGRRLTCGGVGGRYSHLHGTEARVQAIRRLLERYQIRADSYSSSSSTRPPGPPPSAPPGLDAMEEDSGESHTHTHSYVWGVITSLYTLCQCVVVS